MTPRQIAREAGEKFYEGKPCAEGHGGLRYVCNAHCVACAKYLGSQQRLAYGAVNTGLSPAMPR